MPLVNEHMPSLMAKSLDHLDSVEYPLMAPLYFTNENTSILECVMRFN